MHSPAVEALSVLVIEDDNHLLRTLRDILRLRGYAPMTAASGGEGLTLAAASGAPLAVALIDLNLPDMDGTEVIGRLHAISALTETVILTGHASVDSAVRALRQHTSDYLVKPVAPDQLLTTVERATERWQRRRAEEALRRSEERSQLLLENISDVVVVVDEALTIGYVSPSATRVLGAAPEELIGQQWGSLTHPDDLGLLEQFARQIRAGASIEPSQELRVRHRQGEWRVLDVTAANLIGRGGASRELVLTGRDVTERRRLEGQLRQSQKMESIGRLAGVGRLAGGVAHDFNNLLTAIIGFSELLLDELPPDGGGRADLEAIQKAAAHGATLTRQLLAFSRRQVQELKILDLNALVRDIEPILRRLLGEDIVVDVVTDEELRLVKVDRGQIEQVVINLVVNARDAMPHGGNLRIETRNVLLDAAYLQRHPYARVGDHVVLTVSDNGVGMDAEVRGRVFEPFFTTKELGKGTGLGLSMVYGIVKQSGGHIELQSEPGAGSQFCVYLPAVEEVTDTQTAAPLAEGGTTGAETVLLVEDDHDVRELLGKTLERHGYQLLQAATGKDALEFVGDPGISIDLLVTDAVLPELSGPALAAHATRLRPGIRVLFISGYTDDAMLRLGVSNRNEAFLQKPFGSEALLRKVRQLLDGTPAL
jgi:two-component system, cell cycle sensor histidine kinase and response regulator CckA